MLFRLSQQRDVPDLWSSVYGENRIDDRAMQAVPPSVLRATFQIILIMLVIMIFADKPGLCNIIIWTVLKHSGIHSNAKHALNIYVKSTVPLGDSS